MRVVSTEVLHLRTPLAIAAGPAGVYNEYRETLLLKLTADDGTVGWGETYAVAGARETLTALSRHLVGASLTRAFPTPPGLDRVNASFALGAIDIAWHDLVGRISGLPVHTLLGGARRRRVPAYASGFLYQRDRDPDTHWPAEAAATLERGFRFMKLRIGGRAPEADLALLARLRPMLPGVTLMVDAWGSYDAATAEKVGRRLAELDVAWFEEPCVVLPAGFAERVDIPVAGGEMGRCAADFVHLLDRRELDVVQPDVAICGGLGTARLVGELCAQRGVACVPHTWNGAVMAAATLHLAAVLPFAGRTGDGVGGPLLEYDTSENPLIRGILRDPPSLVDGCFDVPDTPGLGIEVDESAVARFRVA